MKLINVEQGSDQWLELRKNHFCASDAPAMMNASKYKSRNQLLLEKKTGKRPQISKAQQEVFDKGHAAEESARGIIETIYLEDFTPIVATCEVDGISLLASLDGYAEATKLVLEHKLWNSALADNVDNGVLDPMYYWQLEHQLLVVGVDEAIFVCSDGTENYWSELEYTSVPERREQLIAGWKQFAADLETYQPEVKQEAIVANEVDDFPLIKYRCEGTAIISNITEVLPVIKQRAEVEMSRTLETDQDFADKDNLNKATKEARAKLKEVVASVQGEFVSFAEFSKTAEEIDSILQKMQSHGEKQVKQAKEEKKKQIIDRADKSILEHIDGCNKKIAPLSVFTICGPLQPDYAAAMKGKRTIESLQNAVDSVVAQTKIEIDQVMARIVPNQIYLQEHATEYAFLFADVQQIINQDTEPFQAIVKSRIADHKKAEEDRLEAERERIREEEERKAKEKIDSEKAEEQLRIENELKEEQRKQQLEEEKEEPVAEVAPTTKRHEGHKEDQQQPSIAQELAEWVEEFKISYEATKRLSEILNKYFGEERLAS